MADIQTKASDISAPTNIDPKLVPSAPTAVIPQPTPPAEAPEDLDSRWTRWRCLVCNYTYEGRVALKKCPRCGNEDPDKFEDVE